MNMINNEPRMTAIKYENDKFKGWIVPKSDLEHYLGVIGGTDDNGLCPHSEDDTIRNRWRPIGYIENAIVARLMDDFLEDKVLILYDDGISQHEREHFERIMTTY